MMKKRPRKKKMIERIKDEKEIVDTKIPKRQGEVENKMVRKTKTNNREKKIGRERKGGLKEEIIGRKR